MPDLVQSLQSQDLGYIRIVAGFWGIELEQNELHLATLQLAKAMLDPELVIEIFETLPVQARTALSELVNKNGRLPWSYFTRMFGVVREMGAGRRDRMRPHLSPVSISELLWYRGLIARSFFDTASGAEEFAYLPEDLATLLPLSPQKAASIMGQPAMRREHAYPTPANDYILDDACTLLAALRADITIDKLTQYQPAPVSASPLAVLLAVPPSPLFALLNTAGLLEQQGKPLPEATRAFLEAPRAEALAQLAKAWLESQNFNELRMLPGLSFEGNWSNDAWQTRNTLLGYISKIPAGTWWSLPAFVSDIKQRHPDFQRPAGDYDSWFIKDTESGDYLRGFDHWERVDGAVVRYLICAPMHWLGMVDLAYSIPVKSSADTAGNKASAFRLSTWSSTLLKGKAPSELIRQDDVIKASSDALLRLSRQVPLSVRYQVARFCNWEGYDGKAYRYRLTPASLRSAKQQGLHISHLIALLRRYTHALPPSLVRALERWEEHGCQASLQHLLVLRLKSPQLLDELRSSRAARYLGDQLGPTTIAIKPGALQKVLAALAELGYLGEADISECFS